MSGFRLNPSEIVEQSGGNVGRLVGRLLSSEMSGPQYVSSSLSELQTMEKVVFIGDEDASVLNEHDSWTFSRLGLERN